MKKGFIVHPFETSGGYHASYGNNNKTVRSFKTLRQAKQYLVKKGISQAMYDNPEGTRDISTKTNRISNIKIKQKSPFEKIMGF